MRTAAQTEWAHIKSWIQDVASPRGWVIWDLDQVILLRCVSQLAEASAGVHSECQIFFPNKKMSRKHRSICLWDIPFEEELIPWHV